MTAWVVALLVVLGLLAGAFVSAGVTRIRFRRMPGAFRCKLRVASDRPDRQRGWPRRVSYGVWLHDVLLVSRGRVITYSRAFPVRFAETSEDAIDVRGLGRRPVQMELVLDDGTTAVLAGAAEAGEHLAGPFIVAQIRLSGPA